MKHLFKRVTCISISLVVLLALLSGCGTSSTKQAQTTAQQGETQAITSEVKRDNVEIEYMNNLGEYQAQYQEIWSQYEKENPNVKIKLATMNEGQESALEARIAAGTPPHIMQAVKFPDKSNYQVFANLRDIGYPYWDKFPKDFQTGFSEQYGVKDYTPILSYGGTYTFSFVYYKDEMDKAGLKPKETVRTIEDLDNFLAQLKAYIDKNSQFKYVFDTGMEIWCWGDVFPIVWAEALNSGDIEYQKGLYNGVIRWDDMEKNPYVAPFKKFKEYYDKGYFPKEFWKRQWDSDFEAGFIAKKSILTFHGPWLWDKAMQADPDIKLDGFPLPASKDGLIVNSGPSYTEGIGIAAAYKGQPIFDEVVKAFNWFNSPAIIKQQCELSGFTPAMDLSDAGELNIKKDSFINVVKPIMDGYFGTNVKLDNSSWPPYSANTQIPGKPSVLQDQANIQLYADYFDGKISLEDFMKAMQKRFDENYQVSK